MTAARGRGASREPGRERRSWWSEPLLHFVIIGTGLFLLWAWVGAGPEPRRIVVTRATVEALRGEGERREGQPAAPAELRERIDRWVEREILAREARELGLDQGDAVIHNRLIQKMEFLLDEEANPGEPDEAALIAHLAAHPERWRAPDRVSFTQVFVRGGRPDANETRVASELRGKLVAGADASGLGEEFPAGREMTAQSRAELARTFGASFADAVFAVAGEGWSPPLRSSFGVHLVQITGREAGRAPDLAEVREAVRRDWVEERRAAAKGQAIEQLRGTYVVVEEDSAS